MLLVGGAICFGVSGCHSDSFARGKGITEIREAGFSCFAAAAVRR